MADTVGKVTFFGTIEGNDVHATSIANTNGLRAEFITFGARMTGLWVPDREGNIDDIVLGFDTLEEYIGTDTYFGATCGRYGNRIRKGQFSLDGEIITLDCNEHYNHLHGGISGFDRKVWKISAQTENCITFASVSEDGEMGYPGRAILRVTYEFTEDDRLLISMEAESSRLTVMNMVNHAYFNLGGQGNGDILDHVVQFGSSFYTPVDGELLATGEIMSVKGTAFDFTTPKRIGQDIEQLAGVGGNIFDDGGGYDHNFCLDGTDEMRACVDVYHPGTGRRMVAHTSEPGVQFYTGGYLNDKIAGKGGKSLCKYGGFTLETQKFPDTPNFGHFPQCRLAPNETYRNCVELTFTTDKVS